jgi:hypothetical protein
MLNTMPHNQFNACGDGSCAMLKSSAVDAKTIVVIKI